MAVQGCAHAVHVYCCPNPGATVPLQQSMWDAAPGTDSTAALPGPSTPTLLPLTATLDTQALAARLLLPLPSPASKMAATTLRCALVACMLLMAASGSRAHR